MQSEIHCDTCDAKVAEIRIFVDRAPDYVRPAWEYREGPTPCEHMTEAQVDARAEAECADWAEYQQAGGR